MTDKDNNINDFNNNMESNEEGQAQNNEEVTVPPSWS